MINTEKSTELATKFMDVVLFACNNDKGASFHYIAHVFHFIVQADGVVNAEVKRVPGIISMFIGLNSVHSHPFFLENIHALSGAMKETLERFKNAPKRNEEVFFIYIMSPIVVAVARVMLGDEAAVQVESKLNELIQFAKQQQVNT